MVKVTPFDTARHLDNPEVIKHYLAEAFKTGDERLIRRAKQNLSRALKNTGLEKLTAGVAVMKARRAKTAKAKVAKKARPPKRKRPQQLARSASTRH